jgi:hypothetical protein
MSQSAKGDGAQPRRKALLVGNSAYVDKAITPLLAPRTDIERLAALLADPSIGGFDVAPPQLDINAEDFRLAISSLSAAPGKTTCCCSTSPAMASGTMTESSTWLSKEPRSNC